MADIELGALRPFVDKLIAEGRFADESEAVQAGLALLAASDRETDRMSDEYGIDALRALIREGVDARDRGDVITISSREDADRLVDDIEKRGMERLAKRNSR